MKKIVSYFLAAVMLFVSIFLIPADVSAASISITGVSVPSNVDVMGKTPIVF